MSQVLYHVFTDVVRDDVLYPLYELEEVHPDLFRMHLGKYAERRRRFILDTPIPFLGCRWADCVFLSPIHPQSVVEALRNIAGDWQPLKYLEIPLTGVDPANMVRYSGRGFNDKKATDFGAFRPQLLDLDRMLPGKTTSFYREEIEAKRRVLYWSFSPQFLHRGQLVVTKCHVHITT